MFTSRAEYRILLRQDNADERLTIKGHDLGLVSGKRIDLYHRKQESITKLLNWLKQRSLKPEEINGLLKRHNTSLVSQKIKAINIALRPQIELGELVSLFREELEELLGKERKNEREILEATEIKVKYSGYIEREKLVAEKIRRLEDQKIPEDIEFEMLTSISTEARQKLNKIRPSTIGQASRISGVSPADISILLMYIGR